MKPVRTRLTNHGMGAPAGMEDTVGLLPVERTEVDGMPVLYSIWAFTDDERRAILSGANLQLGILGGGMPPVTLSLNNDEVVE